MFNRKEKPVAEERQPLAQPTVRDGFIILEASGVSVEESFLGAISDVVSPLKVFVMKPEELSTKNVNGACHVLSLFLTPSKLTPILELLKAERTAAGDGTPTLIIVVGLHQLRDYGRWMHEMASQEKLSGIRLIAAATFADIPSALKTRLQPVRETNVIKMPTSPEVDNTEFKYFYAISPELRALVKLMTELAENNVSRIYLLGGPGTGKTSIAYYYWLRRGKGNFVAVNLTAESTGDKASMKSLLCGHVTGSVAGGGSREGALAFAGDGVCFLDESHGVTGVVMQVLMEVLDSGQYLPFGATKKRALECAVIFASNRSWAALRDMVNLDEHARLGATLVYIPDIARREEDLIAVIATTLAGFEKRFTSWQVPEGVSPEGWELLKNCPWRGNTRTLMRVIETATITNASSYSAAPVLGTDSLKVGIDLWEPSEHQSLELYVSA